LVGQWAAPLMLAKLGAACGTFGVNYLLRKILLFSPSRASTRVSAAPQERA
jgi:hypothetical protein